MSEEVKKVCKECGRELSLEHYSVYNGKYSSVCKDCVQWKKNQTKILNKRKNNSETIVLNPKLEEFTPRQLMNELKARGYTGKLQYVEVKECII